MSIPAEPVVVESGGRRRPQAQLGRYGLWQLRDYAMERGLPTIIVSMLFGYIAIGPMLMMVKLQVEKLPPATIARYGSVEAARIAMLHDVNVGFVQKFLGVVVFLGALFATNGIVADDRKKGYYRFLFSKPISPSRYYGQAFLIHWAGFVAVACAMALLYGALVGPIISFPLVYVLALMFLMYAGIAFALSAIARWDWLSLVAVAVLASFMWGRFGESTNVAAKLLYLLPPLHRTSEIYDAVANGATLNTRLLAWFAGYGIACYVIGLVVLRYRRLAIV
jgi:ABC-type transport system involved in multi-copper enzyme maturation permease subunit